MNKTILPLAAFAATAAAASAQTAFIPGNLVVSRVGDGSTALANTGGAISLLEFTTSGSAVQTINVPTSSLQWSGTATSEGAISLSKDRTSLTIVGYIPPYSGTGSLANRTDANAPRGYLNVNFDGTVGSPVAVGTFSANNIRSGVSDGTGTWLAGGNSGTVYNSGGNTTIQSTIANTRVVNIFGNDLFFSTGAGTQGIYQFSGTPTSASTPTLAISVSNAYDFAFNSDGTVAYVVGNSGAANGFLTRFTFDSLSSTWISDSTISTGINGITGLAVDFGGTSDTIYGVTASSLIGVTFDGTAFGTVETLATAGTNYAFRGLEFAPIPEPSAFAALAGFAALGATALRRRRA